MSKLVRSTLGLFLAVAGSAIANPTEVSALRVEISDYANLEPQTLRKLLSWTERILVSAGISVQLCLSRGSLAVTCENQTGTLDSLVVRIVASDPKTAQNVRRPTLGQSFADQNGGTYATVFLSPVRDQAATTNVPLVVVLAHVAAHEVGHLLLGAQAHASRGLMRANWVRSDYVTMNQGQLHFTPEQARVLASRYGVSVAASKAVAAEKEPR
jgi:hypothetical protein